MFGVKKGHRSNQFEKLSGNIVNPTNSYVPSYEDA